MKHLHLLTRPMAATAVVGFALMSLASAAGATSVSVSVPPILGNAGSNPVVTIGSGWAAPLPGVDATVPVHGDGDATVDGRSLSPVVPAASSTGTLASVHSSVDACIAVALLTDHTPAACAANLGNDGSLVDSLSQVGTTPSLAGSLAQVGVCESVALADGQPIAPCSDSSAVSGLTGSSTGRMKPGEMTGEINDALVANGLCVVATEIGLSDLPHCATAIGNTTGNEGTTTAPGANAARTATGNGGSVATNDVCFGLAAVTGVDTTHCSPSRAARALASLKEKSAQRSPAKAGHSGTGTASTAAVLNAACAQRESNTGTSSPLKSEAFGGLAGLGFVLAGIGSRIGRARHVVTA